MKPGTFAYMSLKSKILDSLQTCLPPYLVE
jgi:hypothetical protein